ncbi:unnamed protein product [Protopolystoma xenopodis]|uniref:Uncharacterized protein n=1 Tax=Protopolystoma xenopodis TaxID=117903 RepID=A0A448WWJ0_9PLAT|nr:unnamed protein product [Protopolystoma xenopodis]
MQKDSCLYFCPYCISLPVYTHSSPTLPQCPLLSSSASALSGNPRLVNIFRSNHTWELRCLGNTKRRPDGPGLMDTRYALQVRWEIKTRQRLPASPLRWTRLAHMRRKMGFPRIS